MAGIAGGSRTYQQLLEDFAKKKFEPVYFLYGEEDFLVDDVVDALIASALDASSKSFDLDLLYGTETDARNVVERASAFPMIAPMRVVVVREFDKLPSKDVLLSYVTRPSESCALVLTCVKPDFRMKAYQVLREHAATAEFRQFYENEIPRWIERKVLALGKSISVEAAELLLQHAGRSLREIKNEIDKLVIYVGDRDLIDVGDVDEVVGISRQFNIFELQSAIGRRDLPRALDILEHMLADGESPVGIIVMLTRFFQRLWLLRSGKGTQGKPGFPAGQPRFIEKETAFARRFRPDELEASFGRLLEADLRLKSSDGGPRLVMTLLLYGLLKEGVADPLEHSHAS